MHTSSVKYYIHVCIVIVSLKLKQLKFKCENVYTHTHFNFKYFKTKLCKETGNGNRTQTTLNTHATGINNICNEVPTIFFFFFSTELPYGWEKIDDPIYGSYYVE